jgi:2,4-dienoyl-CoA reductase-like NADH-dependent reductase (Old Yellow Enzyme family)
MASSKLFSPFQLRDVTFKNRIFVSPMCQYSCKEGMPTPWHLVHLGSRAVGGAALVCVEATAVSREGRISPGDSGIWSDEHAAAFMPIAAFIKEQGAVPAIQLAHAGRKASTDLPWLGGKPLEPSQGAWQTMGPSPLPFSPSFPAPREMSTADIQTVIGQFAAAAKRALSAGFEVAEIHMAHGYLINEFLSPLSNQRRDEYGGSLANRMRLALQVAKAAREVWPRSLPLFARLSVIDWTPGGWDLPQSIELSKSLKEIGIDLIDCSSGGNIYNAMIPAKPGYQAPFAGAISGEAAIATGAVGLITEAQQAENIIASGAAEVVFLARQTLRDPYWPLHAAKALGVDVPWPKQYLRAKE